MRRVILIIAATAAALVLILTFKTHSASSLASPPAAVSSTSSGSTTSSGSSSTSAATSTKAKSKISPTRTSTHTVTGDAADTQYGPVQVKITVRAGKVVSASATEYPTTDPRDAQINSYAIPQLNAEAVQAGSASIDMVSGATFTSQGYITSLQSALDKVTA